MASIELGRSAPHSAKTASKAASLPARLPVCVLAAAAPSSVRPTFMINTGLPAAAALSSACRRR